MISALFPGLTLILSPFTFVGGLVSSVVGLLGSLGVHLPALPGL